MEHAAAVVAAVLEERQARVDHQCLKRRPRAGARNALDCRWVGAWKWTRKKENADQKVRIIRMRLTPRGFKDAGADSIATNAGTSSRLPRWMVVLEAATRGLEVDALDVKKAFSKGVSYKELADATGNKNGA